MSDWNYRVGTRFHVFSEELVKVAKRKGDRMFSIIEVHYDSKSRPRAYGEPKILNCESVADLKWVHRKIAVALKRPVLDLDNWPKIYKIKKAKK